MTEPSDSSGAYKVGRIPWAKFTEYVLRHSPATAEAVAHLQQRHGPLSPEVVQTAVMARYCCIYHDDFPRNFLDSCRAVGRLSPLPLRLCHHISPERWEAAHEYIAGVRAWLDGYEPRQFARSFHLPDSMAAWVHSLLGERSAVKHALAERAMAVLVGQFYLNVRFMVVADSDEDLDEAEYRRFDGLVRRADRVHYASLIGEDGRPTTPELPPGHPDAEEVDRHLTLDRPPCVQKVFRYWEIILSSVGVVKWRGAVPGGGRSRADYEQEFAAYLSAAAEWASGHTHETAEGRAVAEALGPLSPLKRDLVTDFLLQNPDDSVYDLLRRAGWSDGFAPPTS